jgi:hypothetical protein
VPKMRSHHATCECSWRRPPSRLRLRTRTLSSATAAWVRKPAPAPDRSGTAGRSESAGPHVCPRPSPAGQDQPSPQASESARTAPCGREPFSTSDHCWPPPLRTHRSNLAAIAAGRGKEHTPASHGRNHRSACHLAYWTTRRLAFRHGLEQVEVLGVAAGKGGLLGELQLQLFPARDGVEFVGDVLQPGISRTGHCSTTAC